MVNVQATIIAKHGENVATRFPDLKLQRGEVLIDTAKARIYIGNCTEQNDLYTLSQLDNYGYYIPCNKELTNGITLS